MIQLSRSWIEQAFEEDAPYGDPASDLFFSNNLIVKGHILAKAQGIICGLPLLSQFFTYLDPEAIIQQMFHDGEEIHSEQILCNIQCKLTAMLRTERLVLNVLSYLSGIATQTHHLVKLTEPYGVKLLDTRKVLPHYRCLVKYAVRTGGGNNHRNSLSDLMMLKDNHIKAGGGITTSLRKWQALNHNPMIKTEIEVKNLEEALEALSFSPDIIMLDNFSLENAKEAIHHLKGKVRIEISGGITIENIEEYAKLKPDFISTGIITHHVQSLDLSLNLD